MRVSKVRLDSLHRSLPLQKAVPCSLPYSIYKPFGWLKGHGKGQGVNYYRLGTWGRLGNKLFSSTEEAVSAHSLPPSCIPSCPPRYCAPVEDIPGAVSLLLRAMNGGISRTHITKEGGGIFAYCLE